MRSSNFVVVGFVGSAEGARHDAFALVVQHAPPAAVAGVDARRWRSCRRAAPDCPALLSIFTRTGMRWTTFTQLPLAFSAGSAENAAPVPWLTASTWPVPCAARIGVDGECHGRAVAHMGEIGFLQSGFDPDILSLTRPTALVVVKADMAEITSVPGCSGIHFADNAVKRRAHDGVVELALRFIAPAPWPLI